METPKNKASSTAPGSTKEWASLRHSTRTEDVRLDLIYQIAARAALMFHCDMIDIAMDITYCIEGGCNLRLKELLTATEFNFTHDIKGINANLNHETHKLENGFWPRFAVK